MPQIAAAAGPGPRIYQFDPRLAGGHDRCAHHLPRIAGMHFNWLLVDGQAEPSVQDEQARFDRPQFDQLGALCAEARAAGLRVMSDVSPDGNLELAEHMHRLVDVGVAGFRCRHAHRLTVEVWSGLFAELRRQAPDTVFLGDAIGAPLVDLLALEPAGFELLFNSACWWDFNAPWALEQYDQMRRFAGTVTFPESPHGPRLVDALGGLATELLETTYRSRYLFAASFSTGVLMPMGFEFGARGTLPGDWDAMCQAAPFDLSDFIGEVNGLKASLPPLGLESRVVRLDSPDAPITALLHLDHELASDAAGGTVLCINPSYSAWRFTGLHRVVFALDGGIARLRDVTPGRPEAEYSLDADLVLEPMGSRLLVAERHDIVPPPAQPSGPQQRLRKLAADRVVIERVTPEIDAGRFPVKTVVGDTVTVEADVFGDGHEQVRAALRYRHALARDWHEVPMKLIENDRWSASFMAATIGRYLYSIEAWRDPFLTWRADTDKKHQAGQSVGLEVIEGTEIVRNAVAKARGDTRRALQDLLSRLAEADGDTAAQLELLMSEDTADRVRAARHRLNVSSYDKQLELVVDRRLGAFGAWYEMMPRSQSGDANRHGTFDDVIGKLPYVRDLGFDVLYFTPIHPIGRTNRKGPNNSLTPGPDDPGSPYATGSDEGGHDAIHPELGTFEDFARLVAAAHDHGLEIALDFAIQCSPDHPWIKEHPEWFDWRPDGTIKYAENPPKKYQDIVNVHFYREALPSIWYALRDIVLFWVDKGVKIFRVDNPHTKPVPFWEWMIREVQDLHPDVIFLSEAFTRPKMMRRLAKVGYTQSYSYFTWRNHKAELIEYLTELTQSESRLYMRPNFFVNTPDINPVYLQTGGRAGHQVRLVLAALLSTCYGVYNGFEICEATPLPGKEEYLDSEKFEIRVWDFDRPGHIKDDIRLINRLRRENPALWQFTNLTFLNALNDNILAFYKITPERDNCIVAAINLDPHNAHGADIEVPLWEFGLADHASIDAVDLAAGGRVTWTGKIQHVWLDPAERPYAIWRLVPPLVPPLTPR
jgi:starch synthase (maltosyl-transferring)